jgi:hypothetical protein
VNIRARLAENPFVGESVVDAWARAGLVARTGASMASADGSRFLLCEAVRIIGLRSGDVDPYGLTGRVAGLRELVRQGATISSDGVRFGSCDYDAEFGFVAHLVASADESGVNPAVR